ncbi:MAG TPA: NAD(P)/FAD-dependent oxidoreductase [Bacteriovoracaceae bacterium]|nr:NAD(P)/FAD-dependent oxidoreductase [Bacteriovoracaceae bacterium]
MNNLTTHFLIIGAGPAGLIAGIELQKLGHKVIILDRNKLQVRPVCGEFLSPEGMEQLETMNLGCTLEGFQSVKGMLLFSPLGRKIKTQFPLGRMGCSLNRGVFQERLVDAFCKSGGIIFYDSAIERISINKMVNVETKSGSYSSEWLIGADGRQSTVARLLNMRMTAPPLKRMALHCYLKPKLPLPLYGQMHILPDGSYVGINPIHQGEVNFSIVTSPAAITEAGGTKELINFWIGCRPQLSGQFHHLTDETIKTTSPISRTSLDIIGNKVALIGDASGFIDPLTGEGITTAIKSARLLAWQIAKAPSVDLGFINYATSRKQDFAQKERLNHGFQILIKSPLACEAVALALSISERVRNTFIGIVGNVYTPSQAMKIILSGYLTKRF